jgi:hypothetical protein
MFTIVLLTIYRDEAPSAITILALFPENKKSSSDKFLENKKCSSDKIGIFSNLAKKKKNPPGYKWNGSIGLQERNNFFY